MIRSAKLSLRFLTATKRKKLLAVLCRYRSAVNGYIKHIWLNGGSLNKETSDSVSLGNLTVRQRAHALHRAIGVISAAKASAKSLNKTAVCPVFRGGMKLSRHLVTHGPSASSGFDMWVKFSTLERGNRIWIPLKKTAVINKWMSFSGARLKDGCDITEKSGELFLIVWIEIPESEFRAVGRQIGVDIGINKLLATSSGKKIGTDFKKVSDIVKSRRPGSNGTRRARIARDEYVNRCVNQLPWKTMKLIAVENLKNLKKGKKPNRSKSFRKSIAPWRYAYVLRRIELKAQENCVLRVEVSPAYTSQTCPKCKHRATSNRANESFRCVSCGFSGDADFVGAKNILARALGEPMVPQICTANAAKVQMS